MAEKLGDLFVELDAYTSKLRANLKQGLDAGKKEVQSFVNSTKSFLKEHQVALAAIGASITAVITGLAYAANDCRKAFEDSQVGVAKLDQGIKNLKSAREGDLKSLRDYAEIMKQKTAIDDDEIVNMEALLTTFQLSAKTIKTLVPRILDMGAANADTGQITADLHSTTMAVGKAMEGNIGVLRRYGVTMSEAQKEAFKLADSEDKVRIITEVLDQNFAGQAEAVRKTSKGAWAALGNEFDDVKKKIGERLIPVFDSLQSKLMGLTDTILDFVEDWGTLVDLALGVPEKKMSDHADQAKKIVNGWKDDFVKTGVMTNMKNLEEAYDAAKTKLEALQKVNTFGYYNVEIGKLQDGTDDAMSALDSYYKSIIWAADQARMANEKLKVKIKETGEEAKKSGLYIPPPTPEETSQVSYGDSPTPTPENITIPEEEINWGEFEPPDLENFNGTIIEINKALQDLHDEWKLNCDAIKDYTKDLATDIKDSFSDGIFNILSQTHSWKEALDGIWDDIKNAFFRMVSEMIAKWLAFQVIKTVGNFFTGGALSFFKEGGLAGFGPGSLPKIPHAAQGLLTKGNGPIPAILHPDELVIPRNYVGDFFGTMAERLFSYQSLPSVPAAPIQTKTIIKEKDSRPIEVHLHIGATGNFDDPSYWRTLYRSKIRPAIEDAENSRLK
jgi:hypothetical protein